MIRVLHIVTTMDRGGLETMIMNYYRFIDRSKVQFDFIVHREKRGAYDDEIESLGGKIYRLPKLNPFGLKYRSALKDFFDQHKVYSIVHVHQDCLSSIALKVAKKANVPIRIAHSHSSSQDKNIKYIVKQFFKRFIPRYSTHLFACGQKAGKWMFGNHDFIILNNAINANKYRFNPNVKIKFREQLGIKDDEIVVGHVGNFSYVKNHLFLIDIFNKLQQQVLSKLLIVGDGYLRQTIEEKVESLGLKDKVIFTGVRSDIPEIMQAMDVFVFPSLYEGFGIVALEAQAAGLPCVISDKVPLECKATDLIKVVPLSADVKTWSDEIIKSSKIERRDTYEEIKTSGFDIVENAERLQNFYLKLANGEKDICL